MALTCPKGHESTDTDFCSECGAKIGSAPAKKAATGQGVAQVCPDCSSPRSAEGGKFCELCGYNFETGAHGEIPMAPPPQPEKWSVLITVDPALREAGSPDPPADWSPRTVDARRDTLLIGRTSLTRAINPDIALDFDSAISHRHAVLTRNGPSGWSIRDVGSSNGTRLNGKDIQAMVDIPLSPGDRITMGHWTCITLSKESQA